ncbi:MAG: ROK family protein [Bifidobacteriaceae bacterium]|jgi:predicted NBD/HSP70 family sugar kinase|nr:ROK family protein [Bifidobacteriaceae bacterium]
MQYLACDLGGSSLKHALVDEHGTASHFGQRPAPLASREEFVEAVGNLFDRHRGVAGVALSIPGYVDSETGTLISSGAYTALWGASLPELLRHRCPTNISVENDGKCAALAEAWNGALADARDGAVIILGSGTAGGIVKDKRVHRGRGGAAGEFSYMMSRPGNRDLMSSFVMTTGMIGITYKLCRAKGIDLAIQDSGPSLVELDKHLGDNTGQAQGERAQIVVDGKQFLAWVAAGDAAAAALYRDLIDNVAALVNNIQVIFAPEAIALGGGLSRGPGVIDDVRSALDGYYQAIGIGDALRAEIVPCVHGARTNLIGAVYHHLVQFAEPAAPDCEAGTVRVPA